MSNYEQGAKEALKIFLDFINASIRDAMGLPKSIVDDYSGKGLNIEIAKMKGGEKNFDELYSYTNDIRYLTLPENTELFKKNLNDLGVGYAIIQLEDGKQQLAYSTQQRHLVQQASSMNALKDRVDYELDDAAANELFRNKRVNTMVVTGIELHLLRKFSAQNKVIYGAFDPNIHKKDEDYVLIYDDENSAKMERALNSIMLRADSEFTSQDMLNFAKEMARSEELRNNFIDMATEDGHNKVMYSISYPNMRLENIDGNLKLYDGDIIIDELILDGDDESWADKMYNIVDKLDVRTTLLDIDEVKGLEITDIHEIDKRQYHENKDIDTLLKDFDKIKDVPVSKRVEKVKFKDNTIEDMSITVHKKANKNKYAR